MKRLFYFAPSDLQVARVDRQCIVRFCESFAKYFEKLFLVCVKIKLSDYEISYDNLYNLYEVEKTFEIKQLETRIKQQKRKWYDGIIILFKYTRFAFSLFLFKDNSDIIIYFKNYLFIIPFVIVNSLTKKKLEVFFEIHSLPKRFYQKFILKNCVDGIVTNSLALSNDIMKLKYLVKKRIVGTHQGINLEKINAKRVNKEEARKKLNLPLDKKIIAYTGKVFYGYKEIEYYIKAAGIFNDNNILFLIVGGREDIVKLYKEKCKDIKNIQFISFVRPSDISYYHLAADILLLYYPSGIKLNDYRSPGKLFDYMASGNPIVCGDYPVLKEILVPSIDAFFVEKDNPQKLAKGIESLLSDKELSTKLACNALEKVKMYSWNERAKKIADFIYHGID